MMFEPWLVVPATTGYSLVLCFALMPLARRFGLLDHPSARKVHHESIPLVGGPATFLAFFTAVALTTTAGSHEIDCLLVACTLMLISGLVDDRRQLSPRVRFIVQIVACCIMVFHCGVVLTDFGSLMWNGVLSLGWFSVPITIFAALGVINAFNMMDGIDGLSSLVFIIASSAMAWLALQSGLTINANLLIIAAAAVFGFLLLNARLPWNRHARVFLGDSGSGFLGLFLAWQFIDLGNGNDRAFAPMTAVWLFGIPLLDTTRLMVQRWRDGRSSMKADQFHLHHAFLKAGFSVRQTSAAITVLIMFTTAVGLAGEYFEWPEYLMFYGYIVFGLGYQYVMRHCWKNGKFLGRSVSQAPICGIPAFRAVSMVVNVIPPEVRRR